MMRPVRRRKGDFMKKHSCFTVKGRPFFSIGAQLHNSSSYALGDVGDGLYGEDIEKAFRSIEALGANTVAVPVCWDAFEPEEGRFRTEYLQRIIDRVREHGLHCVLLWFGTWKNGQMEYTPAWVKSQKERFHRVVCKDGTETTVLSPHWRGNLEQDKRAFCRMMEFVREYDRDTETVIAVQVENEPGTYAATIRDFSAEGNEAFEAGVPEEALEAARKDTGRIHGAWEKNGCRNTGNWQEVFGAFGAELCSAWALARYIDEIALAGKEIYDIFMYTNVWMDRNGDRDWSLAGLEYPSGGAVTKVLPLWHAACVSLDAVCPDIYEIEPDSIRKTQALYRGEIWPLYVPESGLTNVNATMMFEAVGIHNAIGYHVFAAESSLDEFGHITPQAEAVQRSFRMLGNAAELLLKYRESGSVYTLTQNIGQDSMHLSIGDWECRVSFAGASAYYCGWVAMDYRHNKDLVNVNYVPMSLEEETARGLLIRTGDREFYLVGHKVRLYWNKMKCTDGSIPGNMMNIQHQAHNTEFLRIEEGHFLDGSFVVDRVRSGDEARHGVWAQADCGVVHMILGE